MDTTIMLEGSPGVHRSAGETHTVHRNGEPFAIPYGVPTAVPEWVVEVLTDSRMTWTKVEAPTEGTSPEGQAAKAPPKTEPASAPKKKTEEEY